MNVKESLLEEINKNYGFDQQLLSSVSLDIHPKDEMYRAGRDEHYFSVGFSALACINNALQWANKDKTSIKEILDFPCGYGRVLRFIKAYLPAAAITGSEISDKYLDFCRQQFSIHTVKSKPDFKRIKFDRHFDLIWCGSLLTHLPKKSAIDLLTLFFNALNDDGLVVFTTHGRHSVNLLKGGSFVLDERQRKKIAFDYKFFGYGYSDYNHMKGKGYGISIAKPSWVIRFIEKQPNLQLVSYTERGWDNNQDVVVVRKRQMMPS